MHNRCAASAFDVDPGIRDLQRAGSRRPGSHNKSPWLRLRIFYRFSADFPDIVGKTREKSLLSHQLHMKKPTSFYGQLVGLQR
jgi:hypothetical protein